MNSNKKLLGQYFTITNPFKHKLFKQWCKLLPDNKVIEPFCGDGNIVNMLPQFEWACYDIEPQNESIIQCDTINNFPAVANIAITNPPYLAKNSATRSNLPYAGGEYDDVYKKCVSVMLDNCDYVAAIIPESFITANLFHDRLIGVISLACSMFNDTECPVCLALFVPHAKNFIIYRNNLKLGDYKTLKEYYPSNKNNNINLKFNNPQGELGVICIDNTKDDTNIRFCRGEEIDSNKIKISSRSYTRISGVNVEDLDQFINDCNEYLNMYRQNTKDIFMTAFKGLRKDGMYRRRLSFEDIRNIIGVVLDEYE